MTVETTPFFFVAMFKIKYELSWFLPLSDDVSETGDVSWHSEMMLTESRALYAMKIGTCLWVPVRLLAEPLLMTGYTHGCPGGIQRFCPCLCIHVKVI